MRDVPGAAGDARSAARADENPDRKAQFAFVRPALSRDPARTRRVVRVARRLGQPPARAVGARGLALPAPSAARGTRRRSTIAPSLEHAARDSADRRHLLPEALDGRDALGGYQLRDRRATVRDVRRRAAAGRTRSGCAASSCRRRTTCSAPRAAAISDRWTTPRIARATRGERSAVREPTATLCGRAASSGRRAPRPAMMTGDAI